jgi:hypothetical protein
VDGGVRASLRGREAASLRVMSVKAC